MKAISACLAILFASSLSSEPAKPVPVTCAPADMYRLEIKIRDPETIRKMYEHLSTTSGEVFGFHTRDLDTGAEVLVVPPIRNSTDYERMYIWGHELAHVACGHFHGENPG